MFFRHATPESPPSHHFRIRFSQLGKYHENGLELRKVSGPVFEVRDLLSPCIHDFDSEIVRTDTVMFWSSCETAPGIGHFRGPCRIQSGFGSQRDVIPISVWPGTTPHARGGLLTASTRTASQNPFTPPIFGWATNTW
ncbi:MAG: hypothetical protein EBT09_06415 [Actinobacteria bacterium]|nr:hypothetical protein [Actinomycetota bacterium]